MSFAVIRFGGRQFKVSEGDVIQLQRQSSGKNDVLLYSDGKKVQVGTPVLKDVEVKLKKLEDKRDKKVRVGRFKSKSRYRRVKGHKQPLSVFSVESIGVKGDKKTSKKDEKGSEKKKTKKEKKEVKKPTKKRGRPKKKKKE